MSVAGEYSLLFAANPLPMWVFDVETLAFLEVNDAALAQYGFSRDEMLGMTVSDIRPPDDAPALHAAVTAFTGEAVSSPGLSRHRRKDGTVFTVQITVQDVVFHGRRARLVVAQDVSERERQAAAVRRKEQFLQQVLDGIPEIVFVKDVQHRFTLVNTAWERFTGVSRDKALGQTARDLFPPQIADRMHEADVATLASGARTEVEHTLPGASGPRLYRSVRFPLRGDSGRAEGVVGLAIDVTERKEAEAALRRSETEQRNLVRQLEVEKARLVAAQAVAKVGSWETDLTTFAVTWSAETHRIFETDPATFPPTHEAFLQTIHPDDRAAVDAAFSRSLGVAGTAAIQHRLLMPDDRVKVLEERWQAVFDDAGRAVRAIGTCQDVSEQQLAQESIRVQAHMLDSVREAVIATDLDGRITYVNRFAEELYGWGDADLLGRNVLEITVPEAVIPRAQEIMGRLREGESWTGEFPVKRRDGTTFPARVMNSPILDSGGRLTGVIGISTDLTDEKQAAKALQELADSTERRERLLSTTLSSLRDFAYIYDRDGRFLFANQPLLDLWGLTLEDVVGKNFWDLNYPDDLAAKLARQIRQVLETKQSLTDITPYTNPEGKEGYYEYIFSPAFGAGGGVDFVVGSTRDITERKQAEEEITRSEERFSKVFDSALMIVWISEASSGRLIDVNQRCATFFGYSRDEMVGRTVFELGLWVDAADRSRLLNCISAENCASSGEAPFRLRSGEVRHALVSLEPMTLTGIDEPLLVVVLVDLTAQKELGSQLLQSQKLEAVGRLAGGVAHDFNNSLGVIMGYTELLLRQAVEPQRGKLEQILKATQRASSLTRQLLAFSRKQVIEPRVVDLNLLLSDLQTMLSRLIGEDVDLAILSDPALGQARADPGQLEQVVMNLCVNARDAMPDGGLLRIETSNADVDSSDSTLWPMAPGRYVKLSVIDSGSGIDEVTLSKIFEPFFTTKEIGKGTGLGLAMVYGIVKQAGGYVWAHSEVGRGTTFEIYLPRIDAPVEAAEAVEVDLPPKGSETILLVEDETALREIARELLQENGYSVIEAAGPQEAMEMVERLRDPIDLLITDVVMPGMNGRALADVLVGDRPQLKVLYISGYTDDVLAHRGVLEPGTLLLEKPFTAHALLERVRAALEDGTDQPLGSPALAGPTRPAKKRRNKEGNHGR